MDTSALIMMLLTNAVVIAVSGYFFYKVYKSPLKDVDEDEANFPRGG
jgi:hypothetical protein